MRDAVRGRENFFQLNRASCGEDGPIILTELLGCVGWPELRIGLPDHLAIGLVEDLLPQPVGIDVAALLVFHECDQGTVVHEGLEVCQAGTEGVLGPPTFSVLPFEELNSAPKLAGPLLDSEFQLFLRLVERLFRSYAIGDIHCTDNYPDSGPALITVGNLVGLDPALFSRCDQIGFDHAELGLPGIDDLQVVGVRLRCFGWEQLLCALAFDLFDRSAD